MFASKFSPDGNYIAASFADGTVHIHTVFKGDRVFQPKIVKMAVPETEENHGRVRDQDLIKPIVTSLCWRPCNIDEQAYQNFKAVTAEGRILSWTP